ncbi:phytoene/squalene synthase family protein [Falsiroseomonas tokyonensis]|uniref:Phytoene/squalene synthase family protein n=1 Tax=Falsiroseomonas tokyonensis TaxID=430521 RepID=A0ABV7BYF2_9PROT|nr:phytoene/squalene synthase family protein [Falsiroseomonas tokyonensis]MBU8540553.1 phytoene/squalene synthase family protein [Falsiroseomonas tokyonensis]
MRDLSDSDRAACRAMLAGGSKSFRAAALLLPARIAEPAAALYAFCRVADDAIDEAPDPVAALPPLQRRLDAIYAGRPQPHPADRAFAVVVRDHAIPQVLPAALLEGFAWDGEGRRYATLEALEAYAARVAATVGAMMTLLMGVRDQAALARACDLGVAMQLTNIARDVGEDARNGRLYLPLDWLAEESIAAEAFLAAPRFTPGLGRVVQRLLDAADLLYARAEDGFARLPWDCRAGIGAARHVYAGIGRAVEHQGGDSVSRRAVVPNRRKALLMARGVAALAARRARNPAPPLPATRFLVEAVAAQATPARDGLPERIARAVALFDRLADPTAFGRM